MTKSILKNSLIGFLLNIFYVPVLISADYNLPYGPLPPNCSESGLTVNCNNITLNNDNIYTTADNVILIVSGDLIIKGESKIVDRNAGFKIETNGDIELKDNSAIKADTVLAKNIIIGSSANISANYLGHRRSYSCTNGPISTGNNNALWINPGNTQFNDNLRTSATLLKNPNDAGDTVFLNCLGNGYNLPSNAIPKGIEVRIKNYRESQTGNARFYYLSPTINNNIAPDHVSNQPLSNSENYLNLGSFSNRWGFDSNIFNVQNFNSPNTGVRFAVTSTSNQLESGVNVYINHVETIAWYDLSLQLLADFTFDNDKWIENNSDIFVEDVTFGLRGKAQRSGIGYAFKTESGKICDAVGMSGTGDNNGGYIQLSNLNVDTSPGSKTTVAFWMYWDGTNSVMPFGWYSHDLWLFDGYFGFNTAQGDIYGISSSGLENRWVHVVAIFTNNYIYDNELYINGVKQTLTQLRGYPYNEYAVVSQNPRIGIWGVNYYYMFKGRIDELKIWKGYLTQQKIQKIYLREKDGLNWKNGQKVLCKCIKPQLMVEYTMDNWSGNTVYDSSGNNKNGTAININNGNVSQNIHGKIEKSADFKGIIGQTSGGYIQAPYLGLNISPGSKTTVAFWMYWDGTNSVMPFGWYSHDLWLFDGYFGFNTAQGDIYGISSSGLENRWVHVVAIFTNNYIYDNELYINGVKQTLTQLRGYPYNEYAVVSQNPRIGIWGVNYYYMFKGRIDELKIFKGRLSADDILDMYNQENEGIRWNVSRMTTCKEEDFGYLLLEYSGTPLTCQPLQINIRACGNNTQSCTPYNYGVSNIILSSTNGGVFNPVSISIPTSNNQTTTSLIKTTPGETVISLISSTPVPTNGIKCSWNTDCKLTFSDTGFIFLPANQLTSQTEPIKNQLSYKVFHQYPSNVPNPDDDNKTAYVLKAVKKDDTSLVCVNAPINGQNNVRFSYNYKCNNTSGLYCANPTPDNRLKLYVNNLNSSPYTVSKTGTDIPLIFTNGVSQPFYLKFDDAGRVTISSIATVSIPPLTLSLNGTTNDFTVRPLGYVVNPLNANDCSNNPTATCPKSLKAGEELTLNIYPVGWQTINDKNYFDNPAQLPNFRTAPQNCTSYVDGVTLLAIWAGIDNRTLNDMSLIPDITDICYGSSATVNTKITDVGVYRFIATTSNWQGAGDISSFPPNEDIFGTNHYGSKPFGRFIPDHFSLDNSSIGRYCNNFIYEGYPFRLSYKLGAKSLLGNITSNYTSFYAKGNVEINADNTTGNSLISNIVGYTQKLWNNGVYIFNDNLTFTRVNPPNSYENFRLGLRVNDTDNVEIIGKDMKIGQSQCASDCEYKKLEDNSTLMMLYGILNINNAYGPYNLPLIVDSYLQYIKNDKFVINNYDNCTNFVNNDFNLFDFKGDIVSNDINITSVTKNDINNYKIKLSAPNKKGSVKLNLNNNYDFLKFKDSEATFGIYSNRRQQLYWKEVPAK